MPKSVADGVKTSVRGADRSGVETAASLPRRLGDFALSLPRLGVTVTLTLLVATSALIRSLTSWHKATPTYFPDEYLYAELARSLAETGSPFVRGAATGFPALLQPILTAPLWLVDDVAVAYHLVQTLAALVMSLAAVPVYLLARRVGLGTGLAVGSAALTLAVPDFLYASWILAEPFAYPIALAAMGAGTLALARGGIRWQILFLALVALCVLGRVQFVVLPIAYITAALVISVRERAPARVIREQSLPLAVFGIGLVVGATRPDLVGQYGSFSDIGLGTDFTVRLATNAFGLAYACGWLLVPGAILGLVLAVARPRSREELAFAALSAPLALGLLGEAAAYGDLGRIQERYFFYLLPLVGLFFALYATRDWPLRRVHALLAIGALVAVAAVPLTFATAATGKTQSPFLFAAFRLEQALASPGTGALVLAATASILLLTAVACSLRPRLGAAVALGLATTFCALGSIGAAAFDLEGSSGVRDRFLPAERSWIDRTGLDDVAMLRVFRFSGDTYQQLFWNRSVTSLLLAHGVPVTDAYRVERVSIASDGTLLRHGRPIVRPLVVDEYAGRVELRGAVAVASAPSHRLWEPQGVPRVRFLADGYLDNGWLGRSGEFTVWPSTPSRRLAGRITFRANPESKLTLTLRGSAGSRSYRLVPGRQTTIAVPVCAEGPARVRFQASQSSWEGGRFRSTPATVPAWTADPTACESVRRTRR